MNAVAKLAALTILAVASVTTAQAATSTAPDGGRRIVFHSAAQASMPEYGGRRVVFRNDAAAEVGGRRIIFRSTEDQGRRIVF